MAKARGSFGKTSSLSRKMGTKAGFSKPGFSGGGGRGILRGGPIGSILRRGIGPRRTPLFSHGTRARGRGCIGCALPTLLVSLGILIGVVAALPL